VRPILWVEVKQILQRVEVVSARHRLAVKSELLIQIIDEEERSLVTVTAQQYWAVLELRSPEQNFRLPRQEGTVNHWKERKLDYPAGDPLFVDNERGGLGAQTGRYLGRVGRTWTMKIVEGELQGSS